MRPAIFIALSAWVVVGGAAVAVSAEELEGLLAGCEEVAQDPERCVLTFVVTQVWGRKPGA